MVADVSFVVPTFRRPSELLEAVRSALSQEGVRVDVVVLDDSPEGSARDAVEGLRDKRVQYIKRAVPSGGNPSFPRNEGWPLVTGRYVHFLDDDDRMKPGAYHALVGALDRSPRHGMAFGRIEPFGEDAEAVTQETAYFEGAARRARLAHRLGSRRVFVANMLFANTILVNSACIIRREGVARLGGYDPDCVIVEDVDFYLRAIRALGGVFVDEAVLEYRIGKSLMHENPKAAARTLESYRRIYAKYRAEYGELEFRAMQLGAKAATRLLRAAPGASHSSNHGARLR